MPTENNRHKRKGGDCRQVVSAGCRRTAKQTAVHAVTDRDPSHPIPQNRRYTQRRMAIDSNRLQYSSYTDINLGRKNQKSSRRRFRPPRAGVFCIQNTDCRADDFTRIYSGEQFPQQVLPVVGRMQPRETFRNRDRSLSARGSFENKTIPFPLREILSETKAFPSRRNLCESRTFLPRWNSFLK